MTVWALADLHLSFGVPDKSMDVFGSQWKNHAERIQQHWLAHIAPEDLVLIPGDISWAMRIEEAKPDLDWIHHLPGTKVLLRGNHDYWWTSLSKVQAILPPSIHVIQNNSFIWRNIGIAGGRLWDTSEYQFAPYIDYVANPRGAPKEESKPFDAAETERIFERELGRLEMSLKSLPISCDRRLAMTHYPPISADLKDSRASKLLEKYGIQKCLFGHLHNVKRNIPLFGTKNGIEYTLVAGDYIDFIPRKILD